MRKLQGNTGIPLSLFISYAHEDEPLREQLEIHLSLLRRQGLIADWDDRQILAGEERALQIDERLETASIILLLISPDFLASDYCYHVELQRAVARHRLGEAHVIPIILRSVDQTDAPFAKLQCLPRDGRPVSEWENHDMAFHEITRSIRHAIEHLREVSVQKPSSVLSEAHRTHRKRLIKRVCTYWISGVLEQSLYQAARIELGLHEQPDALANPWRLTLQEMQKAARSLPEGTSITQVYDGADEELLILGEPGAGKTTLLLELARDLLERAENDKYHPVPVIFNLSSWATKRQPLATWLIEEISTKYRFSHKVAASWINDNQVLVLLDGLDEVAPEARSACVEAINAYLLAYELASIVVCSRSVEYFAQAKRLLFQQAVTIQPLTSEQIETHLSQMGERWQVVHQMLQDDLWLRELITTPLMLSILILTYQGQSLQDLPTAVPISPIQFEQAVTELRAAYCHLFDVQPTTQEAHQALMAVQKASEQLLLVGRFAARRRHLFASYTERMLHRRSSGAYMPQQTIQWLSWLAKTMLLNDQTIFSVEMKLKKLPNPPSWIYRLLSSLAWLSFCSLGGGLIGGWVFPAVIDPLWSIGWSIDLLLIVLAVLPFIILIPMKIFKQSSRRTFARIGVLSIVLFFFTLFGESALVGSIGGLLFGLTFDQIKFWGDYHIHNLSLRWYLYQSGVLPWNLNHFLDHAAERIFLRKVGQSYIFIHRLLLDYFAALEISSKKEKYPRYRRLSRE